jgi:hypothetical protein
MRVMMCWEVDAMDMDEKRPLDRTARARRHAFVSGLVLIVIVAVTLIAALVQPAEQWLTALVIVMSGLSVAVAALIVWIALLANARSLEKAEGQADQVTLDEISKLDGLRQSGYLTTAEFEAAKSRLLWG